MAVEERDGPVKLVERVRFDLVDLVVRVLIALEGGVSMVQLVVLVVWSFSKVVVVPSGMVYSALEVPVPVGDLLMVYNVLVEVEQHDWFEMVAQVEEAEVPVLMETHRPLLKRRQTTLRLLE
jgi:hypothetical protein